MAREGVLLHLPYAPGPMLNYWSLCRMQTGGFLYPDRPLCESRPELSLACFVPACIAHWDAPIHRHSARVASYFLERVDELANFSTNGHLEAACLKKFQPRRNFSTVGHELYSRSRRTFMTDFARTAPRAKKFACRLLNWYKNRHSIRRCLNLTHLCCGTFWFGRRRCSVFARGFSPWSALVWPLVCCPVVAPAWEHPRR